MSMSTLLKIRLASQTDPEVRYVSIQESAEIAKHAPGPGTPLSMFSIDIQQSLRDGVEISSAALEEDFLNNCISEASD